MNESDLLGLVRDDQVHRDIYLSAQVFELEMQRLWRRAWLFVGHESQIPEAGDYVTCVLAGQPVIMLRGLDGAIGVWLNRCAHKGAPLVGDTQGRSARVLRCPYHGWTFNLDGSLASTPLRSGYEAGGFEQSAARAGLSPWGEVQVYRGFVFARAEPGDPGFADHLGELLPALDLLADRSPRGRLVVAGGVIRTSIAANWKIYLENINDAVHPVTTHASATLSARAVWESEPREGSPPLAMRQLLPFGSGYSFFEQMGGRVLPHGHSLLGTQQSLHTSYTDLGDYGLALREAHGEARASQVLAFTPQNVVFYPSMALKGTPQVMRVLRPVAADRTVIEAWAFQPEGAPEALLESALLYNRQVFSPMSVVAHDDLYLFEGIQRSLVARGNPWVSLHRGVRGAGDERLPRDVSGVDEALLRNQYQAWREAMGERAGASA